MSLCGLRSLLNGQAVPGGLSRSLVAEEVPDGLRAVLLRTSRVSCPYVASTFVFIALVPCRVLLWRTTGWTHIVVTDVGWTSQKDFADEPLRVKSTAMLVSLLNVFNGVVVSYFVAAFLLKVHHVFDDELRRLWNTQKSLAAWQQEVMDDDEKKAMRSEEERIDARSNRIYVAVLCLGVAFNFTHLGVMFGGIFHYHLGSGRTPWDAVRDTLSDPQRYTLQLQVSCLNALGQFIAGLIIVGLVAVVIRAGCFVLLNLNAYIRRSTERADAIFRKPGTLEERDVNHVALEVSALEEQLCVAQDHKCFGWVFLMAVLIPLVEMLYWVFNLALLSQADVTLKNNTRGLAGFAAGIGCLCFLDVLFMAYMLSTVSSYCDTLRGKVSRLLVRGKSEKLGQEGHLQYIRQVKERPEEVFASKDVDRRIRQIQDYMLYVKAGEPMGFYVYGVHMTAGLFKSLLISYVSLLALLAPKAMQFFYGDVEH